MSGRAAEMAEKESDFSISEYMPPEQQSEVPTEICMCCLCQLRVKSNGAYDFCIKMHANEQPECLWGKPSKKNTQQKNQPRNICEECMDSMILNTQKIKAIKSNKYHCCFDSCIKVFTKPELEKHYFRHLGVKKFKCSICDKDFATKSIVQRHERTHLKHINRK